jgi:thymidylate synthase
MKQYLDLLKNILDNGHRRPDRTGHGRISLYGPDLLRFNMTDGFPLVSTRFISHRIAIAEMLWFISGSTDTKDLGFKIWDQWTPQPVDVEAFIDRLYTGDRLSELVGIASLEGVDKDILLKMLMPYLHWSDTKASNLIGSIGPIYGKSFRNATSHFLPLITDSKDVAPDVLAKLRADASEYGDMTEEDLDTLVEEEVSRLSLARDQIQELLISLKNNPYSSRHLVVNWSSEYLPIEELSPQENVLIGLPALAPCQAMFQCHVIPGDIPKLSLQLYMRSSDAAVGLPYNIAQYAALLHMLAQHLNYEPYELIVMLGDVHVYQHHVEGVMEQLTRSPRALPTLTIDKVDTFYSHTLDNFHLEGYEPYERIPFEVAV